MKTLKLITGIAFVILFGFTACQTEETSQVGTNPNTNSSTSKTTENYKRSAMNDGSKDDFLDGNSCVELLFPLTGTVNGQRITLLSSLDFSTVLNIMGKFNDDSDLVTFDFPISAKLSNYTEVVINNQTELNALKAECENTEATGKDAISCVDIDFPITILTYNVSLEQTGSVVIQSKQQMYSFMNGLDANELFAVNYPFTATLSNGTTAQVGSDADFKNAISDCLTYDAKEKEAKKQAKAVEAILTKSKFKVESFITAGVNKASDYVNWSIDFTNDLKLVAQNTVNTTLGKVEGTYAVSSETAVFLNINFASNTAVSALANDWVVDTYSNTLVTLKSKTDASTTITFKKL
ncbi:hypothetical protein KCTC32516_00835 [Polaribacter huanghezhanensis]|uniref:hypothetical protein n=1 Tax=Polaribacter huanghezhanensis TaxID=1354726 RepID=UPI00264A4951|nr:hypothetical protein [Polaribacter huanghezhanensis]WKD85494.1 hypothetical protein KCTC32516_00835 [Polaribacter huanghezhanensis]